MGIKTWLHSTILTYSILILRIGIFSYWIANRFLTPTAFFLSKSLGFFSFLGYLLVKSFGNDVGYTPGTLKQFCH